VILKRPVLHVVISRRDGACVGALPALPLGRDGLPVVTWAGFALARVRRFRREMKNKRLEVISSSKSHMTVPMPMPRHGLLCGHRDGQV